MKNVFMLLITISLLHLISSDDKIYSFEEIIQKIDKDFTLPEIGNTACSKVIIDNNYYVGNVKSKGKTCSVASIDKGYKCCYVHRKELSKITTAYDCYYFPDKGNVLSDVAESMNIDIDCSSNYLKNLISLFLLLLVL